MKTFLKWHVPVAERWQAKTGGAGGAWQLPVHPLNILSMFPSWPQNHSNVSPPPSDSGSARRPACRKVPMRTRRRQYCQRAQPQPAWHRSGGTGGHGHPSCSSFRQPAWPPSLCRGEGVCFMDTVLKALGHLPPPTILGQNSGRQGLS